MIASFRLTALNTIGRSRPFWQHFFPLARQVFPGALHDVSLDDFYFAVNHVEPTPIRMTADEVTYNLHILIRFELEQALVADDLRYLSWSGPDEVAVFKQRLDPHFRNANLRVAVAGKLLDRILPEPGRIDAPVRDIVVNVPVRGRSSTFSNCGRRRAKP